MPPETRSSESPDTRWTGYLEDLAARLDAGQPGRPEDAARLRALMQDLEAAPRPARIPAYQEPDTQAEVHRRLAARREQERLALAGGLNDGPVQNLVKLLYNLQLAQEAVEDGNVSLMLDPMVDSLKTTIQELREVVNLLRPPTVIRFGLSRAIQVHSEEVRARYHTLRMDLDLVEDENLLPEETCLALYRIYQEGVTNALRHANARSLYVRYYPLREWMILEIRDDGQGFQVPEDWVEMTRKGRFGLAGVDELASALGGNMTVTSEPGQGTRLQVRMPIPRPG